MSGVDLRLPENASRLAAYLDRESHYVWGRRYLLQLAEVEQAPSVELSHRRIILQTRPGADPAKEADRSRRVVP